MPKAVRIAIRPAHALTAMSADPYAVPDSAAYVVWSYDADMLVAILKRYSITLSEGGHDPTFLDQFGRRMYLRDVVPHLRSVEFGEMSLYHAYMTATH